MVPVGDYLKISSEPAGTYEYYLVKQMNLETDEERQFKHPFDEETSNENLLRRVMVSDSAPAAWTDFLAGCCSQEDNCIFTPQSPNQSSEKEEDPQQQNGRRRGLQQEGEEEKGVVASEEKKKDETAPPIKVEEPDNNVPEDTLVCDLHYEQDWRMRRRYTQKCLDVDKFTLPCTGTYACICKQGTKEFYRVSKTLPIIPQDYTGLTTRLLETSWKDDEVTIEKEEEDDTTMTLIIVIVASILAAIVLCCFCYYIFICCAKSRHKVTYDEHMGSQSTNKDSLDERSDRRKVSTAQSRKQQKDAFGSSDNADDAANTGGQFPALANVQIASNSNHDRINSDMKISQAHDDEDGVLPNHPEEEASSIGNKPDSMLESVPQKPLAKKSDENMGSRDQKP